MGPAWVAIEAQLAAHEAALVASSVDVCWSKSSIVFVTIIIIFLSGLISLPQIQILFHVIMYTYCSLTAVITLIITEYSRGCHFNILMYFNPGNWKYNSNKHFLWFMEKSCVGRDFSIILGYVTINIIHLFDFIIYPELGKVNTSLSSNNVKP